MPFHMKISTEAMKHQAHLVLGMHFSLSLLPIDYPTKNASIEHIEYFPNMCSSSDSILMDLQKPVNIGRKKKNIDFVSPFSMTTASCKPEVSF